MTGPYPASSAALVGNGKEDLFKKYIYSMGVGSGWQEATKYSRDGNRIVIVSQNRIKII